MTIENSIKQWEDTMNLPQHIYEQIYSPELQFQEAMLAQQQAEYALANLVDRT